jgi:hypothetical protein
MPTITLIQAMKWMAEAWNMVSAETIRHCWLHAGIVPDRFVAGMKAMDNGSEGNFVDALT